MLVSIYQTSHEKYEMQYGEQQFTGLDVELYEVSESLIELVRKCKTEEIQGVLSLIRNTSVKVGEIRNKERAIT